MTPVKKFENAIKECDHKLRLPDGSVTGFRFVCEICGKDLTKTDNVKKKQHKTGHNPRKTNTFS